MISHMLCDKVHRGMSVCFAAYPHKMWTNWSLLEFIAIRSVCPIKKDPISRRQFSTHGFHIHHLWNLIQFRFSRFNSCDWNWACDKS
jgi:hypothetical protein